MQDLQQLVESFIEIKLASEDAFLLCKETLTRIGIASNRDKTLYQSCHILHKKGRYYVVHFKELFALDQKANGLDDIDKSRRNSIAKLLHDWGLCEIVGSQYIGEDAETGKKTFKYPDKMSPLISINKIKIISHSEKTNWELVSKYSIGRHH